MSDQNISYLKGIAASKYFIGAVLCIVLIATVYFVSSRYRSRCKQPKKSDDTDDTSDDTPTEVQQIIAAIEEAQDPDASTSKPAKPKSSDESEGM